MSEVEGQTTPAVEQPTEIDYKAKYEELMGSKERVLNESKDWKSKAQEYKAKLESIEEDKLRQKGETQKILEKREQELATLKERLETMNKSTLKSNIKAAVARVAKDAFDIDDLLKTDQASMIEYDPESLTPTSESVEKFLNAVREVKPHFFGASKLPGQGAAKPTEEVKTISEGNGKLMKFDKAKMKEGFKAVLNI